MELPLPPRNRAGTCQKPSMIHETPSPETPPDLPGTRGEGAEKLETDLRKWEAQRLGGACSMAFASNRCQNQPPKGG